MAMRKFTQLFAAITTAAILSVSVGAVNTYEAANGTPQIDGKKDNIYVCEPVKINIDWEAGKNVNTGSVGTAYLAWDNDYYYVYVEVVDALLTAKDQIVDSGNWDNDSVEFYINTEGKPGSWDSANAAQVIYGPNFTKSWTKGLLIKGNESNLKNAYTITDYGYTVEIAIPWGSKYSPKSGDTLSISFMTNDDTDGKKGVEYWNNAGPNQGEASSKMDDAWDHLKLSSKKYTAPSTPSATTAPSTPDAISLAVVALAVSAGAAYAVKKHH